MTELPPPGAYCIPDPFEPWRLSYWLVRDGLEPWPANAKYGPQRPPKTVPGGSAEARREQVAHWQVRFAEYVDRVLFAIAADPRDAAARYTRETTRCSRCRGNFVADAEPAEPLPVEARRAIVADLRRAGHPEALIAQALGIGAKTVNADARKAGIGAPLRPKNGGQA